MSTATATQFLPVVASAGATNNSLVVSIHDIAPETRGVVEEILTQLGRKGVRVSSLLVIPHYHHRKSISDDPDFLKWLRTLQEQGHEIVIHGYFHSRPRRATESLSQLFVTRIYTQDEAEFFDLPYDDALERIKKAHGIFTAAGLQPVGFIAPAWLLNPPGEQAARDAGMEYTTRLRTVLDLRSGQSFPASSLVYSVRSRWRRTVSLAWNRALFQTMTDHSLMRLSIHPPDYRFPEIWRQIERFVDDVREVRTPTTYRDWIAEQRTQAPA
jgi:predicted deacetylase